MVSTTDYHTAGEPFRIVTAGVAVPRGATAAERRRWAAEHLDATRALLCREPRGHADMYGGFLCPPDDEDGDLGVVFFHNDGFSTACGHGTIALATWALDTGLVQPEPGSDTRTVVIDVPSGRVEAAVSLEDGQPGAVRFRNVPATVHTLGLEVEVEGRALSLDLAYGGAWYASVDAAALGLRVEPSDLGDLIRWGRAIQATVDDRLRLTLPEEGDPVGLYGVIFIDRLGAHHQRNVTIFADGQVDRSPCGSGTSARLAVLAARGMLEIGDTLVHDSIVGTRFLGRVLAVGQQADGTVTYDTEVEGRAARTGHHTFVLEPRDELGAGFVLR
ncbi:MAG: proline racemase family protein [Nitriliruptoraceae bacterium]